MTNQQTPSIGRIVHYYCEDGSIAAAIITDVHRSATWTTVDLYVMSSQPHVFSTHEVEQGGKPGQWDWPHYVPTKHETVTEVKPIRPTIEKSEPTYVDILSAIRNHGGGTREPERLALRIARMFDPDITEVPE